MINIVDEKIEAGETDANLLREAAGVIRAGATLDAEKRQARKEARRQFESYDHAGVLAWARTIGAKQRRALINELAAVDQNGLLS